MKEKRVSNAWQVIYYIYNRMLTVKEELRAQGKSREEINKIIDEIKELYLSRTKGETDAYKLISELEKAIKEVCHGEGA